MNEYSAIPNSSKKEFWITGIINMKIKSTSIMISKKYIEKKLDIFFLIGIPESRVVIKEGSPISKTTIAISTDIDKREYTPKSEIDKFLVSINIKKGEIKIVKNILKYLIPICLVI
jgi:hypothetical protein